MKVIGLDRLTYPEERNIAQVARGRAELRLVRRAPRLPAFYQQSLKRSAYFRDDAVVPETRRGIDCFHFFNSIPLVDVPFVTTFETTLPRWWGVEPEVIRQGIKRLASRECRGLFAISKNAADIFSRELNHFPAERADIERKLEVLYPPQQLPRGQNLSKFRDGRTVDFAFVGRDFLKKGGLEFLVAFEDALRAGARFRATIVSEFREPDSVRWGPPWNEGGAERLARARAIIARHADRISYYQSLPNQAVLDLFARSHVGALPSYGDTFGFVVLEANSRMCPMVTSDLRAFPEINDNGLGWIVGLPLTPLNRLHRGVPFRLVSESLVDQLRAVLRLVAELTMRELQDKAEVALERVRKNHDPDAAARRLIAAYR